MHIDTPEGWCEAPEVLNDTPKPSIGRCDIQAHGLKQLGQLWVRMPVILVDFILESIF